MKYIASLIVVLALLTPIENSEINALQVHQENAQELFKDPKKKANKKPAKKTPAKKDSKKDDKKTKKEKVKTEEADADAEKEEKPSDEA